MNYIDYMRSKNKTEKNVDGYYSVRERSPFKETFPVDILTTETRFKKHLAPDDCGEA